MTWQEFKHKQPEAFELWVETLRKINDGAGFDLGVEGPLWALEDWDYDPVRMRIHAAPHTKCSIYYVYYGQPEPAWVERE